MNAPTLLTTRLSLKPSQHADYADMAAMWADPDVVTYIGGNTRDPQDAWFAHLRNSGLWEILGYGYWIVRERRTGTFVGEVGFADFKRGLDPDISGRPEAGWVLAKSAWGNGYASEATRAAHDWLDEVIPGRSTCIIDPDNGASIRVAERIGYTEIGPSDYRGDPILLFERFSPGSGKS
ncbi:MAG: GNAT family N-acetyltransferase [Pseudomonadota bacterium]